MCICGTCKQDHMLFWKIILVHLHVLTGVFRLCIELSRSQQTHNQTYESLQKRKREGEKCSSVSPHAHIQLNERSGNIKHEEEQNSLHCNSLLFWVHQLSLCEKVHLRHTWHFLASDGRSRQFLLPSYMMFGTKLAEPVTHEANFNHNLFPLFFTFCFLNCRGVKI